MRICLQQAGNLSGLSNLKKLCVLNLGSNGPCAILFRLTSCIPASGGGGRGQKLRCAHHTYLFFATFAFRDDRGTNRRVSVFDRPPGAMGTGCGGQQCMYSGVRLLALGSLLSITQYAGANSQSKSIDNIPPATTAKPDGALIPTARATFSSSIAYPRHALANRPATCLVCVCAQSLILSRNALPRLKAEVLS